MNVKYVLIPLIVAVTVCVCAVLMDSEESDATADPTGSTRVGDLYYTFSGTNATLTGYASGIVWSSLTSLPNTVEYDGVTYTVTKIGNAAFSGCSELALTSLPSGLTSIGNNAFGNCTNLALTSLPDGVTSIGTFAFGSCTNLALISLPSGLTTIGQSAFYGCTSLALTSLPSGVTSIAYATFARCTNLALTSLPNGVTSVGNLAFQNCTHLEYLVVEGSPTIGTDAFGNCTNLKQILNMGTTPIAAGSYGLSEDVIVRTGSEGFDALVMLQDVGVSGQHETIVVEDDSAASTVLRAVPIFVILAIITGIILAYMRTTKV